MDIPWIDMLNAGASLATAAGVLVAVVQIRADRQAATTEFEDELDREYREIALALPVEALLGEGLEPELQREALEQFHRYFDLANQQVFLRQAGRITDARWQTWADEIEINLGKPAFKVAWDEIKRRAPSEFVMLRRLESVGFEDEPRRW
jgi:hypothetical protein